MADCPSCGTAARGTPGCMRFVARHQDRLRRLRAPMRAGPTLLRPLRDAAGRPRPWAGSPVAVSISFGGEFHQITRTREAGRAAPGRRCRRSCRCSPAEAASLDRPESDDLPHPAGGAPATTAGASAVARWTGKPVSVRRRTCPLRPYRRFAAGPHPSFTDRPDRQRRRRSRASTAVRRTARRRTATRPAWVHRHPPRPLTPPDRPRPPERRTP